MPTVTGLFRCVFLVVVSLLIDVVDCVSMGYQTLSMIGESTRRTPLPFLHKTVQRGRLDLSPQGDSIKRTRSVTYSQQWF